MVVQAEHDRSMAAQRGATDAAFLQIATVQLQLLQQAASTASMTQVRVLVSYECMYLIVVCDTEATCCKEASCVVKCAEDATCIVLQ